MPDDLDSEIPGQGWPDGSEATASRLLHDAPRTQAEKFKAAARAAKTDDSEGAFDAHLKRIAVARPKEGKATDPKADRPPD